MDEQTYVVNPADAAGVTYTMTTYDNLGEAKTTQQYLYEGSESNAFPPPWRWPRWNRRESSIPAIFVNPKARPLMTRSARSIRPAPTRSTCPTEI